MRLLRLDCFNQRVVRVTIRVPKDKVTLVMNWWHQCSNLYKFRSELLFKLPVMLVNKVGNTEYIPRSPHAQTKYGGHVSLLSDMVCGTVLVKTARGFTLLRRITTSLHSQFGACLISTRVVTVNYAGAYPYR